MTFQLTKVKAPTALLPHQNLSSTKTSSKLNTKEIIGSTTDDFDAMKVIGMVAEEIIGKVSNADMTKNVDSLQQIKGIFNTESETILDVLGINQSGRANLTDWEREFGYESIEDLANGASPASKVQGHKSVRMSGSSESSSEENPEIVFTEETVIEGDPGKGEEKSSFICRTIKRGANWVGGKGTLAAGVIVASKVPHPVGKVVAFVGTVLAGAALVEIADGACKTPNPLDDEYVDPSVESKYGENVRQYLKDYTFDLIDHLKDIDPRTDPTNDTQNNGPYTGPSIEEVIGSNGGTSTGIWGETGSGLTEMTARMAHIYATSLGGTSSGSDWF